MGEKKALKRPRLRGNLHEFHVRIPEDMYQDIVKQCDELEITLTEYINTILADKGFEGLRRHAARVQRRAQIYDVRMDDDTRKSIGELSQALNENTRQIRMIGTNLSAFIRDARLGKFNFEDMKAFTIMDEMNKENAEALQRNFEVTNELSQLISSDKIVKQKDERWEPEVGDE